MALSTDSSGDAAIHLLFIETDVFQRALKRCGLDDSDMFALQTQILQSPTAAPIMKETGGLRKMRFSPARSGKGKRGAHRVLYVYFQESQIVLLVTAYAKGKADDLSPAGRKSARKMIEEQQRLLRRGPLQ